MTFHERIIATEENRNLAERRILEGESIAAGEMLWGAVHNVIQAIGLRHNLLDDADEVRRMVVIHHLINQHGYDGSLRVRLRAVGTLHGHFYNRNLVPGTHQELIQSTLGFIVTLVAIASPAQSS